VEPRSRSRGRRQARPSDARVVPFLRLSRDRRGYENTFLLHVRQPGERPLILYWYRTAPAIRVGRPALDEDAIRTIEEQHPDIEFDWAQILEVGAASLVEVERPAASRRKPPQWRPSVSTGRPSDETLAVSPAEEQTDDPLEEPAAAPAEEAVPADVSEDGVPERSRAHDLLEELVGREIATRLHARYAELTARISQLPLDELTRDAWRTRAEALNPDNWVTPDEILSGVERAAALFDSLRRELPGLH
jgi:hypothetical protein